MPRIESHVVRYVGWATKTKTFKGHNAAERAAAFIQDIPDGRFVDVQRKVTEYSLANGPVNGRRMTAREVADLDAQMIASLRTQALASIGDEDEGDDEDAGPAPLSPLFRSPSENATLQRAAG